MRCRVDRVVDWVREHTNYTGAGRWNRLKRVVETERASSADKAMLVRTLLDRAGVESRFAFVRPFRTWTGGLAFPSSAVFRHPVVYVPSQDGLPEPLWIDPSCEECAAGQLPQRSRGVPAQILFAEEGAHTPKVTATATVTRGEPNSPRASARRFRARLATDGRLQVEFTAERTGTFAAIRRRKRRTWSASRWKKSTERLRSNRWPAATMTSDKPDVCSKRPARCLREMAFEIPVYATVGDGHLTVPLTMWKEGRASFFEEEERELDVSVRESREYVDLIELTIPDGYRVATLPEAEEVRGLGFAYRFTAEPTATGVRVERALTMKAGGYPAKKYAEIRAPVRAFVAARAKTIVLEKAPATPVPASPEPAPPSK